MIDIYETTGFMFRDWRFIAVLGPVEMFWFGLILIALIRGYIATATEKDRLKTENTNLYSLIGERNGEIHRLTNELEDARS